MKIRFMITSILIVLCLCTKAQDADSLIDKIAQFPNRFFSKMKSKTASLDQALTKQTEKYLKKLAKQEAKMQAKLAKTDSLAAKQLFSGAQEQYVALENKLKNISANGPALSGPYFPYIDSLKNSLSFLQQNKDLLKAAPDLQGKIAGSMMGFNQLQSKLQVSEQIKAFISIRKIQLGQVFNKYSNSLGVNNYLNDYNKQAYYYAQQIKSYKDMLNDPDKLSKKALSIIDKLPIFQKFMKENSMLAGLLNLPASNAGTPAAGLAQGMPTRDQVMVALQSQGAPIGSNLPSMVQQNVQSAEGQMDLLKNKLNAFGNNGGNIDVPNFSPNNQKSKPFLKRLEYGTNLQTAHGTYFFPTTTDLGLSVGYHLSDKNTIGIGASYKIGWGTDISHVNVSSQGVGFRSYMDMQIKKSFFASGGFEYNYQQPFYSLSTIKYLNSWQQSGLIGISKVVSLKTKLLKKSKIQLLWDFLSYQQIPQTQPLKFRIGYSF